jgi:hypothetical protein
VARVDTWEEHEHGFGWIEAGRLARAGHALAREGRVWLVDPFDCEELDIRVRALGEPAGVVQLLDRHERDCAAIAARLGVPHHVVPFTPPPGFPFALLPLLHRRHWREAALWWPEERLLLCAEAIGSSPYFRARGEQIGVHPFLRLTPPRQLLGLAPLQLLCGHGRGIHGPGVAAVLDEAIRTARRRAPGAWLDLLRRG